MKNVALLLPWLGIWAGVLYLAIHPESGLMYHNPMTAIGLGLIGLGMMMEARKRQTARQTAAVSQRHEG